MAEHRSGGATPASLLGALLVLALTSGVLAESQSSDEARFFEQQVRPLLAQNCFECHGENRQRGNLRLDSLADLLHGGQSGAAAVPGEPDQSLMLLAVSYDDPDLQMPPDDPLDENQLAILEQWVAMGAPWPGQDADVEVRPGGSRITDEDRQWWAYQPVHRPDVPDIDTDGWARNPIDRFVYEKLDEAGLEPAREADRLALIRRAYFDLIGLPPTPQQLDAHLNDGATDWYEKMIDQLLDSPHYGERWGRHWLDLVRYADSDGWRADHMRPHAWRYREYVVNSFNDDKPYDQFVREQLAGDELAPNDPDTMVATGFLRLGVYEWNQRDAETQWKEIIDEMTDVAGDVFLGKSMSCARCHDHKFDAITQEDYYRFRAFFEPVIWRDDVPYDRTAEQVEEYWQQYQAWEAKTASIREELAELEANARAARDAAQVRLFPENVRQMMAKDEADRTPYEQQIFLLVDRQVQAKHERFVNLLNEEQRQRRNELREALAEYDEYKPDPLPRQDVVTDVGPEASPTTVPGDRRERSLEPGFPEVLAGRDPADVTPVQAGDYLTGDNPSGEFRRLVPSPGSTGRRTALAEWITDPQNPLTTRVMTNRIWHYHFGSGLVATPSDFGHLGEPPSHPELLDWLTREYVDNGWTMKRMHRLIMTSATYRQSAARPMPVAAEQVDPDNRLLWRFEPQRLDSDQIRDAMLLAAGRLDDRVGGPAVGGNDPRRTIYVRIRRNQPEPIRRLFDAPDSQSSTADRVATVSPTQALLLLNSEWAGRLSESLANLARDEAGDDDRALIDAVYRRVYNRPADSQEIDEALAFLGSHTDAIAEELAIAEQPLLADLPHDLGTAAKLSPGTEQSQLAAHRAQGLPEGDFTVEAIVQLDSLYDDASVRTIVSQWNGASGTPGWSLGVTSAASNYTPRNLILQLSGEGGNAYDVVPSDILLEVGRPYYVAAVVHLDRTDDAGVHFYVRDLTDADAELKTAKASHTVTDYRTDLELIIGGRDRTDNHHWDGLIGEVRLSGKALEPGQLLASGRPDDLDAADVDDDAIVGHWRFEPGPSFYADASERQNHLGDAALSEEDRVRRAREAAVQDFAHVLLNSNEFLYLE